jgi:hypothetical protein
MITRNRVAFRELQIHIGGEKDDCSRSSSGSSSNNNSDSNNNSKTPMKDQKKRQGQPVQGERSVYLLEGLYLKKMRIMVIGNRCTILSGECS